MLLICLLDRLINDCFNRCDSINNFLQLNANLYRTRTANGKEVQKIYSRKSVDITKWDTNLVGFKDRGKH